MNVGGTASVVTGEDRLELNHAVVVAGLDTAQEGCVEVGGIGRVTVAAGLNAGVNTLEKTRVNYRVDGQWRKRPSSR